MTVPIALASARSPLSSAPNTAPVVEFSCLFTHDLRRKQKRWHDGTLRYHSFNRRIMVYDIQGGYIGDKHWKQQDDPQEGEELALDKGALVEIGVQTTTTQTDLSELLKPRSKPSGDGADMESPRQRPALSANVNAMPPKHKSLKDLLGPRQGTYGKAIVPTKSPYEMRREDQENRRPVDARELKRQRTDNGQTPQDSKSQQRDRSAVARPNPPIDLTAKGSLPRASPDHASDDIRSDVTIPPTPPSAHQPAAKTIARAPAVRVDSNSRSRKVWPQQRARADDADLITAQVAARTLTESRRHSPTAGSAITKPTQSRPLRIVKAPPRKMLMCIGDQPVRKSQSNASGSDGAQATTHAQGRAIIAPAPEQKAKKRTLLDIEDELDALDHVEDPAVDEVVAPVKPSKRTPFQRTHSLGVLRPPDVIEESEPQVKPTRRSPLKKAKSMSTTDAGDDSVAKKSRSSKTNGDAGGGLFAKSKASLKSIRIEPWSIEASDLFAWRRPDSSTATPEAAVAVT